MQKAKREYDKAESNLQSLKNEIVKALTGESAFSPELLNGVIQEQEKKCRELRDTLAASEQEVSESESRLSVMGQQYDDLLEWAAVYETASMSAKKMIVSHIIERVDVYRGYELKLALNISVEQFLGNLDGMAHSA